MKARYPVLALAAALLTLGAHAADRSGAAARSDREKLIGAWHMVSMEEQGADGRVTRHTDRSGMLVFSADGHFSVQVMYPESGSAESANPVYAKGGYEATFGSFDLDEQAHTVTQHVQAWLVRTLIGRNLPRVMQFSPDGHPTLRSANPEETWSVTWEHY
jgi:Lipocalin-like domain